MDRVWGYRDYAGGRVVDSHVARIRRKLREDGNEPRFIRTVHGVGYAFQEAGGMSPRPLEKLPTIRAKLGSVIVLAVVLTIAGLEVVLGARAAELVPRRRPRRAAPDRAGAERDGGAAPSMAPPLATLREGLFAWTGDELDRAAAFRRRRPRRGRRRASSTPPSRSATGPAGCSTRSAPEPGFWSRDDRLPPPLLVAAARGRAPSLPPSRCWSRGGSRAG